MDKKRGKRKGDFKEILLSQFVSVGGGLLAGTLLAIWTDKILLIPGMLILIPGFLELKGNIGGTLAARISSGLFVGLIKKKSIKKNKIIKKNVLAALLLSLIVSVLLGAIAFVFTKIFFGVYVLDLIFISLIAGIISSLFGVPLTLFFTLYLFKKGRDPDNIMGPFVSTTGDVISIVALFVAIIII